MTNHTADKGQQAAGENLPKKFQAKEQENFFNTTITILVGKDEHTCKYTVHQSIAIFHYNFLKAALSTRWREGQEKLDVLIDLYLLGDVLDDTELRNRTLELLIEHSGNWLAIPSSGKLNHVWSSTPSSSLLRKAIIDILVLDMKRDDFDKEVAGFCPELLQDVAKAAMRKINVQYYGLGEIKENVAEYFETEKDKGGRT